MDESEENLWLEQFPAILHEKHDRQAFADLKVLMHNEKEMKLQPCPNHPNERLADSPFPSRKSSRHHSPRPAHIGDGVSDMAYGSFNLQTGACSTSASPPMSHHPISTYKESPTGALPISSHRVRPRTST